VIGALGATLLVFFRNTYVHFLGLVDRVLRRNRRGYINNGTISEAESEIPSSVLNDDLPFGQVLLVDTAETSA
jgi:hypothetical protein